MHKYTKEQMISIIKSKGCCPSKTVCDKCCSYHFCKEWVRRDYNEEGPVKSITKHRYKEVLSIYIEEYGTDIELMEALI